MTRPGRAGGRASAVRKHPKTPAKTRPRTPSRTRFKRRSPSPMVFTDELLADARRRYEQTAEAKSAIGADLGIAPSTFSSLATRLGWTRFTPPPRGLDAAARLTAKSQALVKAAAAAEPAYDDMPMDTPTLVAWLRREIQAQIGIVKQLREQERAEPLTDEAAIRLARILSSLADALTKLDRHTAGPACRPAEPDELPENIDDIRIDLARRIDAFIASRFNAGLPDDAAAAAADGVQ